MNQVSKTDVIEAVLFAAESPLSLEKIAQIVGVSPEEVLAEIEVLCEEKMRIGGLQIREVSGGWQMLTKPELAPFVFKLREAPRQKLSRAAFEVLAITAYRQPITRAEVEELRGVDCSRPLTFLLDKKLVRFAGRKDSPGRPWLYETTHEFLEHFGLRSIADLPPLAELAEMNEAALEQSLFSRAPMKETEMKETGEAKAPELELKAQSDVSESENETEPNETEEEEEIIEEATEAEDKIDIDIDIEIDTETEAGLPIESEEEQN